MVVQVCWWCPQCQQERSSHQEHLHSIDPHNSVTVELPGTDGLPFLNALTKPTPNSIESTVYRKWSTQIGTYDYNSNHPISANLSVIHTLIHTAKHLCSKPEFLAKEIDNLHKVLQDNHYPTHFCQQVKPQQKTNRKPNPSTGIFLEGTRVIIPYIKGHTEQYRHTLAKHKFRVFYKGTNTMKSLLMHLNDPIPDAQKTDIIYHWKCPANNYTFEYIGETNRSLKVFETIEIKPPVPSETTTSPQHPKTELKDFIDIDSNILHCWAKETLHINIKHPSLNKNIGKVRIHSVFNKPLKPHTTGTAT